jgi:hypothetical protein
MRWLMTAFLVSVGGLLLAAMGAACHIWIERAGLHQTPPQNSDLAHDAVEEVDVGIEP